MKRFNLLLLASAIALTACEKEIEVELPRTDPRIVITGTIEPSRAPIVIVSRSENYFDPTDFNSLFGIFVSGALVTVDNGDGPVQLAELSTMTMPDDLLKDAAQLIGVDPSLLQFLDLPVYSLADGSLLGEIGRSYALAVQAEGNSLSSTTMLYQQLPLDSVWFKLANQDAGNDSLGFIWQTYSDPPGLGQHARWMAQRINLDTDGTIKDPFFVAPLFSAFEDKYVDGLTFDWAINRGTEPYSSDDDDENEERGYFKRGDTVVVKYLSIGAAEFDFYRTRDNSVANQGDLFSNPSNVIDNIEGGLGIWAGWTPWYDTLVCDPVN